MIKYTGPKYTQIITHGGKAHMDDLLALCTAVFLAEKEPRLYRRDPTAAELLDPETLVLDVGGKWEPGLNNFDHHQLKDLQGCALSLFADHVVDDSFNPPVTLHMALLRTSRWYDNLIINDSKGPIQAAKAYDVPVETYLALSQSPLNFYLLGEYERLSSLASDGNTFTGIGRSIVQDAFSRFSELKKVFPITMSPGGIGCAILSTWSPAFDLWRADQKRQGNITVVGIYPDDRGPGWTLYRYDDDPRIDFSRLEGEGEVTFAHKNGFVAKTASRCTVETLLELVRKATV